MRIAHDFHCPPAYTLPPRQINDHALLYFREGRGTFRVGGRSYEVEPGALFFIRPDVVHSFVMKADTPIHMLNLHFDLVERIGDERISIHRNPNTPNPRPGLESLPRSPRSPVYLPPYLKVRETAAYERAFYVVCHAFPLRHLVSQLTVKSGMIEVLTILYRQMWASSVAPQLRPHLPQLERAARYMSLHLDRPLTLEEMAHAAALSRSYFATSFAAYYKLSPAKFHLRQRIERAALDLILGPRSIKDVATTFGFQTVHHFSRCFTRLMGLPPAAYRQAHGGTLPASEEDE